MSIICAILCIILVIFEKIRSGTFINPFSIFYLEWACICITASINIYDLYPVDDKYYLYIFVGLICFAVGYYLYTAKLGRYRIVLSKNTKLHEYKTIKYKLLLFLMILSLLYYSIYLYSVYKAIPDYNLWAVQRFLRNREIEIISNRWIRLIGSFIAGPISTALPAVVSYMAWYKQKYWKQFLILSSIILILRTLATGNRASLIMLPVMIAIVGLLKIKDKSVGVKITKKAKKIIVSVIIISIVVFVILSVSRRLSLFRSLYLDFAIVPSMFQKWGEYVEAEKCYGYGMASLNGILFTILYFIQTVFGFESLPYSFQNISNIITLTDTNWVYVGNDVVANAYTSIFWYLYLDGRIIGIVIGMFLFGIYCCATYNTYNKSKNIRSSSLYCMCLIAVIYSISRMQFSNANFAISLLYVQFILFR